MRRFHQSLLLAGAAAVAGAVWATATWPDGPRASVPAGVSGAAATQRLPAPIHGYRVVNTFPHDTQAFTQGLVYAGGELYESTGLYGESSLRRVELETGKVVQRIDLPAKYFGEGLALVGDALVVITWRNGEGLVFDRRSFEQRRTFTYETEGWGLAYDETRGLAMSDGSDRLFFLDPESFAVTRTVRVQDAGRPVRQLNELEWVEDELWANAWPTDRIVRIAPETGAVVGWIDLGSLWPRDERTSDADVMNGIAYDPAERRIFVTGKKWPTLYQIVVTPAASR